MEDGPGGEEAGRRGVVLVNARDPQWVHNEKFGAGVTFEGTPRFTHYGINVQVMWPGQPNCYYHGEEGQEDFLVLSGECLLLIEGEERRLGARGTSCTVRPGPSMSSWARATARVCSWEPVPAMRERGSLSRVGAGAEPWRRRRRDGDHRRGRLCRYAGHHAGPVSRGTAAREIALPAYSYWISTFAVVNVGTAVCR